MGSPARWGAGSHPGGRGAAWRAWGQWSPPTWCGPGQARTGGGGREGGRTPSDDPQLEKEVARRGINFLETTLNQLFSEISLGWPWTDKTITELTENQKHHNNNKQRSRRWRRRRGGKLMVDHHLTL